MGRVLNASATPRGAAWAVGVCSLLMVGLVSAAWLPPVSYPPGARVRPMLPIMATAFVLFGSGRLVWEVATLRQVPGRARLAIATLPLIAAGAAAAWPVAIRAVLGLDMSG